MRFMLNMYLLLSHIAFIYSFTILASIAALVTMARRASAAAAAAATATATTARSEKPSSSNQTKFFGSQTGGQSIINYSYTVRKNMWFYTSILL